MASVPSIDHQKASTVFRSVEQSHIRDVLPVVEDRLRAVLEAGETLPDVRLLAALLGRVQVAGTERLAAADKTHEEELANDGGPRELRDEAGGRVYSKLVEVRRIADGLFGPERTAVLLGSPGVTASVSEGERLWRQAEDTIKRLEDPAFAVPVMSTESLRFDPVQLASELKADNARFRAALDAVALEQRRAETTLAVKKARIAESTRTDQACGRIYEGFFLLADRRDLFDRLRRALRRTRRSASGSGPAPDGEAPDDGAPEEGEPPDGEPDGEPPSSEV